MNQPTGFLLYQTGTERYMEFGSPGVFWKAVMFLKQRSQEFRPQGVRKCSFSMRRRRVGYRVEVGCSLWPLFRGVDLGLKNADKACRK